LARLVGVSTDTLRHYERKGLIRRPSRSSNGYREYAPDTLQRVRVVRAALGIGFTLDELARLFHVREQGGIPCRDARDLAKNKIGELEMRIAELSSMRDRLKAISREWDRRIKNTEPGKRAHLLDSLVGKPPHKSKKESRS
jgi:DNA-binding transcriptional MerR regulator